MSRGLGALERWIITRSAKMSRLYYADILIGFYGWRPTREPQRHGDGSLRMPGEHLFSMHGIGVKKYRSAQASISRACRRLQDRGLVECLQGSRARWSGVEVTEAGRDYALTLPPVCGSVNTFREGKA